MFVQLVLPNIEFLSKKEVVVQVSDCPVHRVTVSHLHHCCSRLAFHELNLNDKTILQIPFVKKLKNMH